MGSAKDKIDQKLAEIGVGRRQLSALIFSGMMIPLVVRMLCGKEIEPVIALCSQIGAVVVAMLSTAFTWFAWRPGKVSALVAIFVFFVVCGSFVAAS